MNKKLIILLVLVVLAGLAYWLLNREPWSTLKGEMKDFAIKDTAQVTRMFFADKKGGKVLLQRNESNAWMVNNTFPADPDKINLMLATVHDLEVRNLLTENEYNTVIGILATYGIKSEFYAGDKLIKTIYVGSSTPDQTGTYMLIEGSSKPFVTHIPGFVGYLTPRFVTEENKWKTKEIFDVPADKISKVTVTYPMDTKQSFIVENGPKPVLRAGDQLIDSDEKFLQFYLGSFRGLFFEGYSQAKVSQMDSVRALTAFCIIELDEMNGEHTKLQVHLKAVDRRTKEQYDEHSAPLPFDREKYFAFINDGKEMVIIQDYAFSKILRKLDEMKLKK